MATLPTADKEFVPGMRRNPLCRVIAPVLLVLLPLAGCPQESESGARNVLLVTLDTLRADHVGSYGYPRSTTPHLDTLASRATRFSRAMSSSPWTLPSHASLFTGLEPFEHGAVSFLERRRPENAYPLAPGFVTLAEILRREGFATGAFVSNRAYLSRRSGLDQGFDTFEVRRELASELNRRILPWLDEHRDRAFFLFVNYMDSHRPYNTHPLPGANTSPVDADPRLLDQLIAQVMGRGVPPEQDLVRRVIAQYDTGVSNSDAALGALIHRLEQLDLYDETLIVVTSDHGEYFGEHRLVEHSKDVYQEALWVPLVVKEAGQRAGRVESRIATSSRVPGLVAGALAGPAGVTARAKFPRRPGQGLLLAENYYTRTKDLMDPRWGARFRRVRRSVYDWPFKYIHSSDGHHELYDLDSDPSEARNLLAERGDVAARLSRRLQDHLRDAPRPRTRGPVPDLTASEAEALRELGYAN